MGGCQNYGPFLGTLNIRGRIIIGTQKGTIILTTTHIVDVHRAPKGNVRCLYNGPEKRNYLEDWVQSSSARKEKRGATADMRVKRKDFFQHSTINPKTANPNNTQGNAKEHGQYFIISTSITTITISIDLDGTGFPI